MRRAGLPKCSGRSTSTTDHESSESRRAKSDASRGRHVLPAGDLPTSQHRRDPSSPRQDSSPHACRGRGYLGGPRRQLRWQRSSLKSLPGLMALIIGFVISRARANETRGHGDNGNGCATLRRLSCLWPFTAAVTRQLLRPPGTSGVQREADMPRRRSGGAASSTASRELR